MRTVFFRLASFGIGAVVLSALSAVGPGCGMTQDFRTKPASDAGSSPPDVASPLPGPSTGPSPVGDGTWELVNPQPVETNLYGAWGTSPKDMWLVGQEGRVYRFDGMKAVVAYQGPIDDLYVNVWGSASDDVWVTGVRGSQGIVLHHDGKTWQADPRIGTEDVHAIHGFARNDVWAALDGGRIMHFDGTWTERFQSTGARTVRAIWGTSANDLWFAGDDTYLAHYDGTELRVIGNDPLTTSIFDGKDLDFYGVWGAASDDVWLFATEPNMPGTVYHWNGFGWMAEPVEMPVGVGKSACMTSSPIPDRVAGGEPYGGGRRVWSRRKVWGAHTGSAVVVAGSPNGYCTVVKHRSKLMSAASTWWETKIRHDDSPAHRAFWAPDGSTLLSVGDVGQIGFATLDNPDLRPLLPSFRGHLESVSVGKDGETWARSQGGAARWTPLGWTSVYIPPHRAVDAIGVGSASDVWIALDESAGSVAAHTVRHWNGSTWSAPVDLGPIASIEHAPDGSVWALTSTDGSYVGDVWTEPPVSAWRYLGGEWTKLPASWRGRDVSFTQANEVFSYDQSGIDTECTVLRWDGDASQELFRIPSRCAGIHTVSSSSIFVAGRRTWHWDGETAVPLPIGSRTWSVWGVSDQIFFGAGRDYNGDFAGDIVRWDGAAFTTLASSSSSLTLGGSGETAFAVGEYGTTFRFRLPEAKPTR